MGEEALPEENAVSQANPETPTKESVPSQTPKPNVNENTKPEEQSESEKSNVTTEVRQPLKVPDSVHVKITPDNLKEYLGPPTYHKDRLYTTPPPFGVSTGLGYLGNGSGAVMPIEAVVSVYMGFCKSVIDLLCQSIPGKGNLNLTGKLGEVIRESAQIGLSWVRRHAYDLGITTEENAQFLNDRDIHVHMPEGSIGKEGPSAGTALLSAFVSLFTKTQVNPDIGEFAICISGD